MTIAEIAHEKTFTVYRSPFMVSRQR